ncbi:hypothetical protein [Leptospira sp. GIMC2001]|uniref:hypothetical protein n=1 Tax=Leptospira sp. GIMC2001 TaxID=1513297 RepID=UPI002349BEAA|nr:hypothetical protein [Leptospira sp. GIMC2001]WCL49141.1 hypothetical protein O4O04_17895 [Leptospira sp. GIMC2001]
MKTKTIIIAVILFVIFDLALFWSVSNWNNLRAFPSIISSFYSKEFCSCYYVVERDEDFCHNYARQWVPISDFKIDEENKRIIVSGLGRTNSAKFTGSKYGCVLEELD